MGKGKKAKKLSADFLMENVQQNSFQPEWFAAKAKIKFRENDGGATSFNVDIRMKKDSLIWLSATPTFIKMEVARAVITPQQVQVIDRFNKHYYDKDFSFFEQYIDYPLDFETLQNLIYGQVWNRTQFKEVRPLDNQYHLESEDCTLFIDSENFSIIQMIMEDVQYNRSLIANFEEYQEIEGDNFSNKRNYLMKADDSYNINILFSKIKANEMLNFPFKVSSKYKKVK